MTQNKKTSTRKWSHSTRNSPGLWPLACQILDIIQSINHSINSWFLVFGAWVLGPIVFLIHRARIWGCARGGSRATFLGPIPLIRPYNFVLKSLLFSIPFFFDFGSILGAKMTPKIQENPLKITFESALQLRSVCDPIFIDFSFDFRPSSSIILTMTNVYRAAQEKCQLTHS